MAIYFNDKVLSPKKDGNEMEKIYFKGLEEVNKKYKENGGTIVLVRDIKRISDTKGISFKPIVPFALPTSVPIYLEEMGAVSIRYSPSPPQREGKELIYPTYRNFMYERLILTEKNKDLAWFLLKASNFIEDGDSSSKKVMRIHNPEKNLEDKASEVKRIAKVDALLMNEDSLLYNKASLQEIADQFGIDIKNFKKEAAGYTIREAIIEADNKRNPDMNIKAFLEIADEMVRQKEKQKLIGIQYKKEDLDAMYPTQLNPISDSYKTQKMPQVTKNAQVTQILEAQLALVETV